MVLSSTLFSKLNLYYLTKIYYNLILFFNSVEINFQFNSSHIFFHIPSSFDKDILSFDKLLSSKYYGYFFSKNFKI